MKTNKYFAITLLAINLIACKNEEKKAIPEKISIDSSQLKQIYSLEDQIPLQLKNPSNIAIDSVIYLLGDKTIAKSELNKTTTYKFENEKFGDKNLRAKYYIKKESFETSVQISLLPNKAPEVFSYEIINTYPHDIKAYTQGLEFYNDILIESTGNGMGYSGKKGVSSIRKVNPTTGEILKIKELPESIFSEGATVLNHKIYQLTYRNNQGFVYDVNTFETLQTLPYFQNMEGWGLTNDGSQLLMTNGNTEIFFLNPEDFSKINEIVVATNQQTIPRINELEWVDGKIYANIYGMDSICIIDPKTGAIEGVVDLQDLKQKVTQHIDLDVLNGIAYNKKTATFFVTGKNWDKMFEIKIKN